MNKVTETVRIETSDTESRILEAAEKEFLTKGYVAARTTSIAEAAGVTHAMLHYYYRSKEKLFAKVISEKISGLAKSFVIPFEEDDSSLEDCLRHGIEHHFDFIRNNPDLPRFMVTEVFHNPELMNQLQDRIRDITGGVLIHLQHKIDSAADSGLCRSSIKAQDLMMDIISLNVFPILGLPMIMRMIGDDENSILETRIQSNIDTILRKIKP